MNGMSRSMSVEAVSFCEMRQFVFRVSNTLLRVNFTRRILQRNKRFCLLEANATSATMDHARTAFSWVKDHYEAW